VSPFAPLHLPAATGLCYYVADVCRKTLSFAAVHLYWTVTLTDHSAVAHQTYEQVRTAELAFYLLRFCNRLLARFSRMNHIGVRCDDGVQRRLMRQLGNADWAACVWMHSARKSQQTGTRAAP